MPGVLVILLRVAIGMRVVISMLRVPGGPLSGVAVRLAAAETAGRLGGPAAGQLLPVACLVIVMTARLPPSRDPSCG